MAAKKAVAKGVKQKSGRPTLDREAIVSAICAHISTGGLVKDACAIQGISRKTLHLWTSEDATLGNAYARAREEQAHAIAEEALEIADAGTANGSPMTSEEVARARLRVDTRKWLASKLAPRAYGEKVQQEVTGKLEHEHSGTLTIDWGGEVIPL